MWNNEEELLILINEWLFHNNKMKEINNYLYNHTELFNGKYPTDYKDDLFRYFAGKITRYTRDYNTIYSMLSDIQIDKMNKLNLIERRN